ncbi:hypothetical protein Dsin_004263 [Dipteronia sinensis]|uniref:E3 SUMO-protein ligase SIZ1 n=1 Tax=Dipteronia sinensis TaxID=43782 RepID=A0AAE0B9N2_9ROSI|nr:hypothetical protein Dsin_004263 [Dipteronia sinensis]
MDLASRCQSKLANFRVKELKDILTRLGLSKQGRKQDLVGRIQHALSDERVAKIIDETHRKMQILDDDDLATNEHSASVLSDVNLKMEVGDSLNSNSKICCPCGNSLPTEFMIQCVDPRCLVQQHTTCVMIPENTMEEISPMLPFFCEMCRIKRADPFWVTVAHLVSPVKLVTTNIPTTDGTSTQVKVESTFHLTKAYRDLLQNSEYDVQAWCILLNDKVPFRMQWPQYVDLQVNGLPTRTINRPVSQLLGANGRDDGALITLYITEGVNKISLSGYDVRNFCFGVRFVKRRTVDQVLSMIPKETEGELFEDALARVRRCIGGGMATENEDSDSDLEVITDSIKVNLRCPMSGSRMKVAGRFKPCVHMGCFDLDTFVELNQRSRKWQCPICLKNYSLEDVIIDPFFNRITTAMLNCGEDITEIEVKPDGSWVVKGELGDLAQWHLPDGSLFIARNDGLSNSEISRQIKQEDSSRHNNPTVGNKNNPSGTVQVSKHQPITLSPRNQMEDSFVNYGGKITSVSSSATGSSRDNEDINQDFGTQNQISITRNTDIIILSDSEEENVNLVSPQPVYSTFSVIDNAPPGFSDSYLQDPALVAGTSSCLGLFSGNSDDVGISNWPYTGGTRAGSGFQLFGTDADVPDVFIDMDLSSVVCSAPMNSYISASKAAISSSVEVLDSSVCHTNIDLDEALIDNPLSYVHDDPSLQNFLPIQPSVALSESVLGHQPPTPNGIHSNDWISLRLGSNGEPIHEPFHGDVRDHSQPAATNGLELTNGCESNGAVLSGEHTSNRTNNKKLSDGPFSFPRQPRSVRQRVRSSQIETRIYRRDPVRLEERR